MINFLRMDELWGGYCETKSDWCATIVGVVMRVITPQIARFMGPTWGPSGADRTQVGPMLAPWILLSGTVNQSMTTSWKCFLHYRITMGKPPFNVGFSTQRASHASFGVLFDASLNKLLNIQLIYQWFTGDLRCMTLKWHQCYCNVIAFAARLHSSNTAPTREIWIQTWTTYLFLDANTASLPDAASCQHSLYPW